MIKNIRQSDQLYKGSDINERSYNLIFKKKTKRAIKAFNGYHSLYSQGLFNREVQAMWKDWVQVYERGRAWPQILFISKPSREKSGNGIHSPESSCTGKRINRKLAKVSKNHGRHLQYKQRNITSQKKFMMGAINNGFKFRKFHRYSWSRRPGSKHDSRLYKEIIVNKTNKGGSK
mgnify:CR=1 FL=1